MPRRRTADRWTALVPATWPGGEGVRVRMPPSRKSRRALLAAAGAAAAAGLGACASRARARGPAPGSGAARGTAAFPTRGPAVAAAGLPRAMDTELYIGNGTTAADAAAFGRFDRSITPVAADQAVALRAQNRMPLWAIAQALQPAAFGSAWEMSGHYPLDEALHLDNFQPSTLLAGALDAFTMGGHVLGMPLAATPLVLAYRPAAFAAAGVSPPDESWTFGALADACDALLAAKADLGARGLYGPLPPLLGNDRVQVTTRAGAPRTVVLSGTLRDGMLIQAFVAGYGGWLARDGRFSLTNAGALQGLSALAAFAGRYGAPDSRLYLTKGGAAGGTQESAMDFVLYPSIPAAGWRYSRLPRLPVAPVIPVQLEGMHLIAESGDGELAIGSATAPPAITAATVQFALWQYSRQAGTLGPSLAGPVLADPAVQARYWSAPQQAAHVQAGIGDSSHYFVPYPNWPELGTGRSVAFALFQVLSAAAGAGATTPSDLEPSLSALEQSLNAAPGTLAG